MFIIDAHLDLSMNAMEWNRDLRLPVHEIRKREEGMMPINPIVQKELFHYLNYAKEILAW
jgi:hypothetical protein